MLLNFATYSPAEQRMVNTIRSFNRHKLRKIWQQIKNGNTPGWATGKALEYMLVRAFDLEGAEVVYPYNNNVLNAQEQFDGYVFVKELGAGFLIECKEWNGKVAFDELAKLHGRLTYRMSSTFGIFLSKNGFTPSAVELMFMMHPHNVLLWSYAEIDECFKNFKFMKALKYKYQYAMITANPNIAVIDGLNI